MHYQAVLFDFDGTLFDTEHDEMTALSALVTQATGVEPPKDKLLKTFGMTGPDGIRFLGCNEEQAAWVKQSVSEAELAQFDAAESLELYLDSAVDFAEAGTEQIGGADATKFTGVIKGDKLYDVIEESGVLGSLGQTGTDVSEDELKAMLSELGDLPMSVWINADGYPVQYEMDMSQMIDSIVQNALEAEGAADQSMTMTVSKAAMSLTCSNFDAVEDFERPAEAQTATAA